MILKSLSNIFASFDRQFLVFVVIVLVALFSFGRLNDPFVAHDDYDWLIGSGFDLPMESPWIKTFTEGRWINYPWSLLSKSLTPYSAFSLYLFFYACFSILAAKVITCRAGVLAALLIFFAPMVAVTSRWPVTQLTGVMIFCIAFMLMTQAATDRAKLSIMPFAVIAGFLSYPSFGPLLLILYGASFSGKTKGAIAGLAVYVVSFVTAVLVAFTLNYIFHGLFTIQPAPWREATPLFSTGTLRSNVGRYLHYYTAIKIFWPALFAAAIGYGICFLRGVQIRQCASVLVFGLAILGMEAILSVVSGLDLPRHSSLWLWGVICIPAVFLVYSSRFVLVGIIISVAILLTGALFWHTNFEPLRMVYPAMRHLGHQISQAQALNDGKFDEIIMYGDAKSNRQMAAIHSNRMLRNFLFKEFNIYARPCKPDFCEKIQVAIRQTTITSPFLILDGKLVVILSPDPTNEYWK